MRIIRTVSEMQAVADSLRIKKKTIGFVPTMGFLHEGHLSLIRKAKTLCDVAVVSIFVNPAQFGPNEDFDSYPRDLARDEKLCAAENVQILFYPIREEMYPSPYFTYVHVEKLDQTMCGTSRPGHFRGVTTIVTKLFNAVKPHVAVFGQKDYQQAVIIRQMVKDLNMDVKIVVAPIVREPDGLAMSSRNSYLSPQQRKDALVLYKSLQQAEKMIKSGERSADKIQREMKALIKTAAGAEIDYIAIADGDNLNPLREVRDKTLIALAVKFGKTRLIDNTIIRL